MDNQEYLGMVNMVMLPPTYDYVYGSSGSRYIADIHAFSGSYIPSGFIYPSGNESLLEIWECGHCGQTNRTKDTLSCVGCGAPFSKRKK